MFSEKQQLSAVSPDQAVTKRISGIVFSRTFPVHILARALDLLLPVVGAWGFSLAYLQVFHPTVEHDWTYLALGLLLSVMFISVNQVSGLYSATAIRRFGSQVAGVLKNWVWVWLVIAFMVFALKIGSELSRGVTLSLAIFGVPVLVLSRLVLARYVARSAESRRERVGVLWLGDAPDMSAVIRRQFHVAFGQGVSRDSDGSFSIEQTREFVRSARSAGVRCIIVAARSEDTIQLQRITPILSALRVPVLLHADQWASQVYANLVHVGPDLRLFRLNDARKRQMDHILKRALDIAVVAVSLPLLLPLMGMIAIAIKLDSRGPVIFRQRRLGQGNRPFTILKFRSMSVLEDGAVVRQATRDDDRVTKVGRFLRSLSLDELPQLINVLRGEMSIVGPRPHAISHDKHYEQVIEGYAQRRFVKPGLTGWAQIHDHRGETASVDDMRLRVAHDLWYVHNWTIWVDVSILAQTFGALLRNRDVY